MSNNRNHKFMARAATSALMLAMAPAALAQAGGGTGSSAGNPDGEIIVTARFKQETLQDVPQAISAFDEKALERTAARDLTDLAPSTPNVSIQPVATFSNSAAIYIRGLGAQGIESTEESPVGIAIDGVYVTRPVATMLDTFDLERVEVLRGPQGTSFGKNSLAGGISAYTKNPTGEFGVEIEATAGNYGRLDGRVAINLPLVKDVLSARLVASQESLGGYFFNRYNGERVGGQDRFSLRGTLLFTPSEDLTVNLKGWWLHDRSSAPGGDAAPDNSKLLYLVFGFSEPNDGAFTIGRDFPASHDTDQYGVIGTVNAKLGQMNLTSTTGYIKTNDFNDSDFDQSEKFFFPTFRVQAHRQFSQELRLATDFSDADGALARLNLVLGGYYMKQSFEMSQAFPTLPVLLAPSLRFGSQDFVAQDNTAKALFAQAIYGVTEDLNITLGVRQSWEDKNYFRDPTGLLLSPAFFNSRDVVKSLADMEALANTNFAAGKAFKDGYSRNRATFKAGIDYKVSPDLMVYAGWSQGYKGGGYGARSASMVTAGPTDDNTSELFEAGMKGDFLDGMLRFNLTGFVTKFKKLEFGVFIPNPAVASGQETATVNVGAATTKGLELETTLKASDAFKVTANVGYLDSKYDSFCTDLNGPSSYTTAPTSACGKVTALANGSYLVDENYTHLKLVRAPKWTAQIAGEYTVPLGDKGELTARLAMLYRSAWYSTVLNDVAGKTGDFALVDGSLGWESGDGRFRAMVWGKNLTNKHWVSALTPTAQFFIQRFYGAPRTFGMTVGAKF